MGERGKRKMINLPLTIGSNGSRWDSRWSRYHGNTSSRRFQLNLPLAARVRGHCWRHHLPAVLILAFPCRSGRTWPETWSYLARPRSRTHFVFFDFSLHKQETTALLSSSSPAMKRGSDEHNRAWILWILFFPVLQQPLWSSSFSPATQAATATSETEDTGNDGGGDPRSSFLL